MTPQAARTVKIPNAEHPITIVKSEKRIKVVVAGEVIAESENALTLKEASYAPVQYIPLTDVKASFLRDSDHATYCPYKGECSYFDVAVGNKVVKDAVWYYRNPYPAVAKIAGHVAFYADRVDEIIEA